MVGYVNRMDIKQQLEEGLVKERSTKYSKRISALPLYMHCRCVTIGVSFDSCIVQIE
jgi:hypothetical protein